MRRRRISILLLMIWLLGACSTVDTPPVPTATAPPIQQLRIENAGNIAIPGLVVLLPGANANALAMQVPFGDLVSGGVTAYQNVPSGVYRYSAYSYRLNNQIVTQPVTDWMGEKPLLGQQFTYRIAFDPTQPTGNQIKLLEVLIDTP